MRSRTFEEAQATCSISAKTSRSLTTNQLATLRRSKRFSRL